MPLVSICIPTYKNAETLKKVLESIKIQRFGDYEIIISDDTPGNSIKEVVGQYDFIQPLYYYHNDPALGSPANWNAAVEKATGKYIKILHHDDWFARSESLSIFVSMMEAEPDADFAFCATEIKTINNVISKNQPSTESLSGLRKNPAIIFNGNFIGGPSATMYKRSVSLSFDEKLRWLVDIDFYMHLLFRNPRFAYSNELLVVSYEAEDRVTNSCINNKAVEVFEHFYVYDKLFRLFGNKMQATNLLQLAHVCFRHNIKSVSELRTLNYNGRVPLFIRLLLVLNNSSKILVKIYLRIFRLFFRLPAQEI